MIKKTALPALKCLAIRDVLDLTLLTTVGTTCVSRLVTVANDSGTIPSSASSAVCGGSSKSFRKEHRILITEHGNSVVCSVQQACQG
jgi:hypothetical protein